jgi:hypothetical protein
MIFILSILWVGWQQHIWPDIKNMLLLFIFIPLFLVLIIIDVLVIFWQKAKQVFWGEYKKEVEEQENIIDWWERKKAAYYEKLEKAGYFEKYLEEREKDNADNGGRQTYSLDGVWQLGSGTNSMIVAISGSTGVFANITSGSYALLQDALNKGYIKIGDSNYRNLTKTGDLTWTGQALGIRQDNSNPNVAIGTNWENDTITLNANGQTFTDGKNNICTWTNLCMPRNRALLPQFCEELLGRILGLIYVCLDIERCFRKGRQMEEQENQQ